MEADQFPKCASAIAQANFAEYIFATSAPDLLSWGWPQIGIRSLEVFEKAGGVVRKEATRIVQGVLREQTDDLFQWQFQPDGPCPSGCARAEGVCEMVEDAHDEL
jgi:tRNA(Arg) A34 adenosine deaminase TadA